LTLKALAALKQAGLAPVSELLPAAIESSLTSQFGKEIVPAYILPSRLFKAKLNFGGEEFFYGSPLDARLTLENTGSMPLVIGSEGLLTGRYRIDAHIRGDINKKIACLQEGTFRPGRAILPGESITLRLDVNTGQLAHLLFTCPQASVDIDILSSCNCFCGNRWPVCYIKISKVSLSYRICIKANIIVIY